MSSLSKVYQQIRLVLPILGLLILLFFLRLPNFADPYWYGDEGIYLTIGNALQDGQRLYADIIDHKTPIIYYLAALGNQTTFRWLLLAWMTASTAAFYSLSKKITNSHWSAFSGGLFFVVFTSIPWFEGHIPNGELFVMGFVLVGGWLLASTRFFSQLLHPANKPSQEELATGPELTKLTGAGVLFGLAILTKVPALLDVVAWFGWWWFWLAAVVLQPNAQKESLTQKLVRHQLGKKIGLGLVAGVGVLLPILFSALYFLARGSGPDYLDFGLLYNFRYAGYWQLPFSAPWLVWLFSLPGKVVLLGAVGILLSVFSRWLSVRFQFGVIWFWLALVAATLSNRPYPHYFLQVIPPLALLLSIAVADLTTKQHLLRKITSSLAFLVTSSVFILVLLLLDVGLYNTQQYYSRYAQLTTGRISPQEYRESFNHLMRDNYKVAEIMQVSGYQELFIWGTNPMLYALTNTYPPGRFTVSFHIKDFDAYEETIDDVLASPPKFVVTMHDESTPLPDLEAFLQQNYMPHSDFEHLTLWMKKSSPTY